MLQDLYKGFKKVAEDDASATLEHENGHRLNIAKSGLNRQQVKALSKLPLHQAKGSEEELMTPAEQAAPETPQENTSMGRQVGKFLGEHVVKDMLRGATEAITTPIEGAKTLYNVGKQAIEDVAPVYIEPVKQIYGGLKEVGSGITEGVTGQAPTPEQIPVEQNMTPAPPEMLQQPVTPELQAAQAEQEQKLLQANQLAAQEGLEPSLATPQAQPVPTVVQPQEARTPVSIPAPLPTKFKTDEDILFDANAPLSDRLQAGAKISQSITDKIRQAEIDFQRKMAEEDINPDRVFENMSTGRKIRTIIGVLLSGAGSGLAGGENLALTMLNREIERDVDLQKQNREKKFNLYKMHLEALGNERAAYLQTMNNLRDIADIRMKEALGLTDPRNKAGRAAIEAALAKNELEKRKAHAEMANLELEKLYEQREAAGQQQQVMYEPKAVREKTFTLNVPDENGKLQQRRIRALSPENAQKAQIESAIVDRARAAFNAIQNFNRTKGTAYGGEEAGEAEILNNDMATIIAELRDAGVNDKTIKLLSESAPKAGAFRQSKQVGVAKGFARLLDNELIKIVNKYKAR